MDINLLQRSDETLKAFCERLPEDDLIEWTARYANYPEKYLIGSLELQRRVYQNLQPMITPSHDPNCVNKKQHQERLRAIDFSIVKVIIAVGIGIAVTIAGVVIHLLVVAASTST